MNAVPSPAAPLTTVSWFPLNRWWVAGFSWELTDKPLARMLLNRAMVLFRTPDGAVAALEDRCCHKDLPLSCGAVEQHGPHLPLDVDLVCPGGVGCNSSTSTRTSPARKISGLPRMASCSQLSMSILSTSTAQSSRTFLA